MNNDEYRVNRDGFALASLLFGIVALVAWRWANVGTLVSVMAVGYGIVAIRSKQRLLAGVGVLIGAVGLILSLTTVFLRWP